jgi:hypothetical protein
MSLSDNRRWFRLTPGRVMLALVALEGCLLLSARFSWFAFNEHKGWTVLIAVAVVGITFMALLLWFLVSLVFRLRFQFSIQSLLVSVLAVALPCSWLGTHLREAESQNEAVQAIRAESLGELSYAHERIGNEFARGREAPGPKWLRSLLGDDFFSEVDSAEVWADAGFRHLKRLPHLRELLVLGRRDITDAGLEQLRGLAHLQVLHLEHRATDGGLRHLRGLAQLRKLYIWDDVSDADLEHLRELKQLQLLYLDCMPETTDAGLKHLGALTGLRELTVCNATTTDAGLEYLGELTQLRKLDVHFMNVTDAGLRHVEHLTELRELDVRSCNITDVGLEHFRGLTQLEKLNLHGTQITERGVNRLREALPNCEICRYPAC